MGKVTLEDIDVRKALRDLKKRDKRLAGIIEKVPFTLSADHSTSPYQALIRSIVFQQLNGKAASTIYGRFTALFSRRTAPSPAILLAASDELLRSAGLSRAKTLAIKDLALKTQEGLVPTNAAIKRLTNDEIVERISQVRGIGPWTVEMMLMFKMGRVDVMPCTDYGVRKGFALLYKRKDLPEPRELLQYAEKWRPYRSIASWYMWRVLDVAAEPR